MLYSFMTSILMSPPELAAALAPVDDDDDDHLVDEKKGTTSINNDDDNKNKDTPGEKDDEAASAAGQEEEEEDEPSQGGQSGIVASRSIHGEGEIETIFTAKSLKKLRSLRSREQGRRSSGQQQQQTRNKIFRLFRHYKSRGRFRHGDQSPAAVALRMTSSDHRPQSRRRSKKTRKGDEDDGNMGVGVVEGEADDNNNMALFRSHQEAMLHYEMMSLLAQHTTAEGTFFDGLVDSIEKNFASAQWDAIESTLSCSPYSTISDTISLSPPPPPVPVLEENASTTENNTAQADGGDILEGEEEEEEGDDVVDSKGDDIDSNMVPCTAVEDEDPSSSPEQQQRTLSAVVLGSSANMDDDDESSSSSSSSSSSAASTSSSSETSFTTRPIDLDDDEVLLSPQQQSKNASAPSSSVAASVAAMIPRGSGRRQKPMAFVAASATEQRPSSPRPSSPQPHSKPSSASATASVGNRLASVLGFGTSTSASTKVVPTTTPGVIALDVDDDDEEGGEELCPAGSIVVTQKEDDEKTSNSSTTSSNVTRSSTTTSADSSDDDEDADADADDAIEQQQQEPQTKKNQRVQEKENKEQHELQVLQQPRPYHPSQLISKLMPATTTTTTTTTHVGAVGRTRSQVDLDIALAGMTTRNSNTNTATTITNQTGTIATTIVVTNQQEDRNGNEGHDDDDVVATSTPPEQPQGKDEETWSPSVTLVPSTTSHAEPTETYFVIDPGYDATQQKSTSSGNDQHGRPSFRKVFKGHKNLKSLLGGGKMTTRNTTTDQTGTIATTIIVTNQEDCNGNDEDVVDEATSTPPEQQEQSQDKGEEPCSVAEASAVPKITQHAETAETDVVVADTSTDAAPGVELQKTSRVSSGHDHDGNPSLRKVFQSHKLKSLLGGGGKMIRSSLIHKLHIGKKKTDPSDDDAGDQQEQQQHSATASTSTNTKEESTHVDKSATSTSDVGHDDDGAANDTDRHKTTNTTSTSTVVGDTIGVENHNDDDDSPFVETTITNSVESKLETNDKSHPPVDVLPLNNSMGEDVVECCEPNTSVLQQLDRREVSPETFAKSSVKKDAHDDSQETKATTMATAATTATLPPQPANVVDDDDDATADDDVVDAAGAPAIIEANFVSFSSSSNSNSLVRTLSSVVTANTMEEPPLRALCDVADILEIWDTDGVEQVVARDDDMEQEQEQKSPPRQIEPAAYSERSILTELSGTTAGRASELAAAEASAPCGTTTIPQLEVYEEIYKSMSMKRDDSCLAEEGERAAPSITSSTVGGESLPLTQFRNDYPHLYERLVNHLGVEFLEECITKDKYAKETAVTKAVMKDLGCFCGEDTDSLLSSSVEFSAKAPSKPRSLSEKLQSHQRAVAALQRMSPLFARSASPLFHRPESSTLMDASGNETAAVFDETAPNSSSQPLMSDEQSTRSDYNAQPDPSSSKQYKFWKKMQKINAKFPKLNREVKQKHEEEEQLEEVASAEDDQKDDEPLLKSHSGDEKGDLVEEEDGIEAPSLEESTGSSSSSTTSRSGSSSSSTSSAASTPSSSSAHSEGEEEEEEEDDGDESGISLAISDYGNTSFNDEDISLAAESVDTTSLLSRKSGTSAVSHPSRSMLPKSSAGNSSVKSASSASALNANKVKRYPVRLGKYETIVEEVGAADETAQEVRTRPSKGSTNRKTRYANL